MYRLDILPFVICLFSFGKIGESSVRATYIFKGKEKIETIKRRIISFKVEGEIKHNFKQLLVYHKLSG